MDIHLGVFSHNVSDKQRKIIDEPVNIDLIAKNKYANNSEFVPDSVYKRILNKMTNYQWSFIPHSIEELGEDKKKYIRYIGLLIVPGFGVHTGIGTQPLNKTDNANATSAAKTYAFKNACKEMGLAPNIGDKLFEEDLFENDIDEGFDLTEDEEDEPVKKPKKKAKSAPTPKKTAPKTKSKKTLSIADRIEEVRSAYELEDEDEFVAFIQIWDEDILELSDMDDDDYEEFITYLEKNKSKFEEF